MLVVAGLELEPSQTVKKFGKVFFIPVQKKIEVRVWCDSTDEDPSSLSLIIVSTHKDANFSKLKLVIFSHDGVVMIVVEKHDMSSVFEAVTTVVYAFVLPCCDYVTVVGWDGWHL